MAGQSGEQPKLKVFVSYSRDDLDFADQLVEALRLTGFDPVIDRHGIRPGEDWKARLGSLIREADTVAFLLSPDSAQSDTCAWEVGQATSLGKRIIPVLVRSIEGYSAPKALSELNYIFFYPEPMTPGTGFGSGLVRLVAALNSDLGWIRDHTRLLIRATDWANSGRLPIRLLSGGDIDDAKDWLARQPSRGLEATELHRSFIKASEEERTRLTDDARQQLERIAAAQDERARALLAAEDAQRARETEQAARHIAERRRRSLQRVLTAVAIAAAIGLGGLSYFLSEKTREAIESKQNALELKKQADEFSADALTKSDLAKTALAKVEIEKARADAELGKAQLSQSRLLKTKAEEALKEKDFGTAALLALSGLPDERENLQRPVLPGLRAVLDESIRQMREVAVIRDVNMIKANREVTRAVSWDGRADHDAILIDTKDGKSIATLARTAPAGAIRDVGFDPLGRAYVHSENGRVSFFDGETGRASAIAFDCISPLEFSPDGQRVACQNPSNTVELRDTTTGEFVEDLFQAGKQVSVVIFSGDSRRLALLFEDNMLFFRDGKTGKPLTPSPPVFDSVIRAAFSADGSRFFIGVASSIQPYVAIYDARTFMELSRIAVQDLPYEVAFSKDNVRILMRTSEGKIVVYDTASGTQVFTLGSGTMPDELFQYAAYSSDGQAIIAQRANTPNSYYFWDAATGDLTVGPRDFGGDMRKLDLDSGILLTESNSTTLAVHDFTTGQLMATLAFPSQEANGSSFVSEIGAKASRLLVKWNAGIATLWDISPVLAPQTGAAAGASSGEQQKRLSPDMQRTFWTADDKLNFAELATGKIISQIDATRDPSAVELNPRGTRALIVGGDQRSLSLRNADTGREIAHLAGHEADFRAAAFSSDDALVATAFDDGNIRVWDATSGAPLANLNDRGGTPGEDWSSWAGLRFTADSRQLVAFGGRTIAIWRIKNRERTGLWQDVDTIRQVAISTGDRLLAIAEASNRIVVRDFWNGSSYKCSTESLEGTLYSMSFSPDGGRVVAANAETANQTDIRVFDAATCEILSVIHVAGPTPTAINFSDDGNSVLVFDGARLQTWPAYGTLQSLVDAAKARLPRCLTETQVYNAALDEAPDWCLDLNKWPYHPRRFGLGWIYKVPDALKAAKPDAREGVYIYKITPGYPAEAAGLQVNDRILSINGISADDANIADKALDDVSSDGEAVMRVMREASALPVEVRMKPRY